jgi:DNA-binding NarL/FixJ family response regulator
MDSRYVLIVEDDSLLRELLATALESWGYQVQTASNVADAKRLFKLSDPDGVILDVDLGPGLNGFDLAQIILTNAPATAIVFLTNIPDSRFVEVDPEGLPTGIAYLRKSALSDLSLLSRALDVTMRGEVTSEFRHDKDVSRPFGNLTRKQIEVLRLMSQGRSNAQIAEARGTSVKAVEDAIRRACEAIGVDSSVDGNTRTAAVAKYLSVTGVNKYSVSAK